MYPILIAGVNYHGKVPVDTRQKIRRKHRLWTRYLKTVRIEHLNAYRKSRNDVPSLTRKKYQDEQNIIALCSKTNTKKFWNYIKSKTTCRGTIGDIKITRK